MIILGIDPSLRGTGYGVLRLDRPHAKPAVVDFGVIKVPAKKSQSAALAMIHEKMSDIIAVHKPDVAAVEGVIYLQNYQTAISLGAARGASLLALGQAGLAVYEYAPRRVKAAATGTGGAQKQQVGFMIRAVLGLTTTPPPDAADALAVALTHAQSKEGITKTRML